MCADPNNLPYSNQRLEGFENRIAALIAADLDAGLEYTWLEHRRGFIRKTMREGLCDVVMGIPSSFELVLPTKPYYRSTYVFVYPTRSGLSIRSFDDPVLRELRIGVHLVGDDYQNPPPAHALGNRGIIDNVIGFSIGGISGPQNPLTPLLEAVAAGDVDVAILWGPPAGYFAKHHGRALEVVPVSPQIDLPFLPFVFDISVGVPRGDSALKAEIEAVLDARRDEIRAILDEYGVPLLRMGPTRRAAGAEGRSDDAAG